jgi:hypothetical protein
MTTASYQAFVESIFRRIYGRPVGRHELMWTRGEAGESLQFPGPSATAQCCSGLVMVADGVGGLDLCGTALRYILGSLGSSLAVTVVPWGHGFGRWHADLTRVANRDVWGGAIAAAADRYRAKHPDRPVFLVAKSGGSGAVIKALERVAPGTIDRVILLAPALSPSYDLTTALRGVRREMFVFWSPLDLVVLGAGTRIFGTIDRIRCVSAGLVGFRVPRSGPSDPGAASGALAGKMEDSPPMGYAKLRQIRWRPSMIRTGYFGGHIGPDSPAFLRMYIAPLLRPEDAAGP